MTAGTAIALRNMLTPDAVRAAIRDITDISQLGTSVLYPQKRDRFIRKMQLGTVLLPASTMTVMTSNKQDIDLIEFATRVLKPGRDDSGANVPAYPADPTTTQLSNPTTITNQLDAQELVAWVLLYDSAARRSIEGDQLQNTIVDLLAQRAGQDFEQWGIFADKAISWDTDNTTIDSFLSKTDGWARKADHKVYGQDVVTQVAPDYDPADAAYPVNMFDSMIAAMPKQYIGAGLQFSVDYDALDKYRDYLALRDTGLGDSALVGNDALSYKGIPIVNVPNLNTPPIPAPATDPAKISDEIAGRVALLDSNPNRNWGVFEAMSIEDQRRSADRATGLTLSMEGDVGYADTDASVVALSDKANPTAL